MARPDIWTDHPGRLVLVHGSGDLTVYAVSMWLAENAMAHFRLAVLLRWGTETLERVPASSSYTCRPLIG